MKNKLQVFLVHTLIATVKFLTSENLNILASPYSLV